MGHDDVVAQLKAVPWSHGNGPSASATMRGREHVDGYADNVTPNSLMFWMNCAKRRLRGTFEDKDWRMDNVLRQKG